MHFNRCELEQIESLREAYRQELDCQIVHDSAHYRPGLSQAYALETGDGAIGYGCVWNGPYWMAAGSIFEFYVTPPHRSAGMKLFDAFVQEIQPPKIYAQTNDPFLGVYIHQHIRKIEFLSILFEDRLTTRHSAPGLLFRQRVPEDQPHIFQHKVEPIGDWIVEKAGQRVGTGGFLLHYNKPYSDIHMEIAPEHRHLGFGRYLVQELKRASHEAGRIPCARTSMTNLASRHTLASAGFSPCGHLIVGDR